MTVVAVVALAAALQLFPLLHGDDMAARLVALAREVNALRREKRDLTLHNKQLQSKIQEAARNDQMFQAIQQAQQIVDEFSREQAELHFEADQSLQFGEDLVEFDINGLEPRWKGDSQERLKQFCRALSSALLRPFRELPDRRELFTIEIEGHTDNSLCPGDPHCNWRISSGRAAAFAALMRDDHYCPGGASWNMVPVGLADTRPVPEGPGQLAVPTRRIAVRLVPNYKALMTIGSERRP
jgi:flagellar motor protein MotB